MGRFRKTEKRVMPTLNTSSLPDLIFSLLFFFMIVTTMREETLKLEFRLPQATELNKLERKSLVTHIYVGRPSAEYRDASDGESCIQLNDSFAVLLIAGKVKITHFSNRMPDCFVDRTLCRFSAVEVQDRDPLVHRRTADRKNFIAVSQHHNAIRPMRFKISRKSQQCI